MQNIFKILRNEKGSILTTFAIMLPVLVITVLAGVDINKVVNTQSQMRHTLDQALLSSVANVGKSGSKPEKKNKLLSETAWDFFEANMPNDKGFELVSLEISHDPSTMQWTATATGTVETFFAKTGISPLQGLSEISHTATVEWDTSLNTEIVLTLDTSASMCMKSIRKGGDVEPFSMHYEPDKKCEKLEALKSAVDEILDNGIYIPDNSEATYKVGVIPFNHKVKLPRRDNIPTQLKYVEENHSRSNNANYYNDFSDAEPLSEIYPLTSINNIAAKDNLIAHVWKIDQSHEGLGWTRSNIAALTAAMMLDPEYYNSFNSDPSAKPKPFGTKGTEKIVVLMTDGANIGCCYSEHPKGSYDNQFLYLNEVDNAHLTGLKKAPHMRKWNNKQNVEGGDEGGYLIPEQGICDQMKDQGIKIYSIVFDVDDRDVGGKAIKDAYKYCATNDQFFFDVMDGDSLEHAYDTVARSLLKIRLIK